MIFMREELIDLLEILIDELDRDLNRPQYYIFQKDLFEQLSYEKWAYEELLEEVETSANGPYAVVEGFCKRMNDYSLVNPKTSRMFSAAYDAGMNVLDLVIRSEYVG